MNAGTIKRKVWRVSGEFGEPRYLGMIQVENCRYVAKELTPFVGKTVLVRLTHREGGSVTALASRDKVIYRWFR